MHFYESLSVFYYVYILRAVFYSLLIILIFLSYFIFLFSPQSFSYNAKVTKLSQFNLRIQTLPPVSVKASCSVAAFYKTAGSIRSRIQLVLTPTEEARIVFISRDYQGKRVNPPIGPLTKVILHKLFLDMVPSSSEDITCAMRGQLKPLCRNYLRRNGGNVIVYVLISFHSRDVFLHSQLSFCFSGFSFVLCSFGCSLFSRLFGFRGLN